MDALEVKVKKKKKSYSPVNCKSQHLMIREELAPPFLEIDRNVFRKTKEEKLKLKEFKLKWKAKAS